MRLERRGSTIILAVAVIVLAAALSALLRLPGIFLGGAVAFVVGVLLATKSGRQL